MCLSCAKFILINLRLCRPCSTWSPRQTLYRVVENKLHKIVQLINFEPFVLVSRCLHPNVRQRLLSTNQCKIYVNGLNILCWVAETISRSSRTERRCTERYTQWPSRWQKSLTSLNHQTGRLIHPIWISLITQFGAIFSSRYIVRSSRTLNNWNRSWTVVGTWLAKNWSTELLT